MYAEGHRAKDTRLDREVAFKVPLRHFADDAEQGKCFEREAQALASLDHCNVAQIPGVGQAGDSCFLALELMPGESLEERPKHGPLPLDAALEVCQQIAGSPEAALGLPDGTPVVASARPAPGLPAGEAWNRAPPRRDGRWGRAQAASRRREGAAEKGAAGRAWFDKLPGGTACEGGGMRLDVPLTSMAPVSVVPSALSWILWRWS